MAGQELYHFGRVGDLFLSPIDIRFRARYEAGTQTWVPDPRPRISHPGGELVRVAEGVHELSGLPRGNLYHLFSLSFLLPAGLQPVSVAHFELGSGDPAAGTVRIITRSTGNGMPGDPSDGAEITMVVRCETGAYDQ